ncbi:MAG TPA: hypothetical protein VFP05_02460 [Thermomicrobiales bacterium]|nr:hypothetical protein [Thermomicrobiales bacterium]
MSGNTHDLIVFGIVLLLRLLVPLAIPRFPLPAIIVAMIIDAADQTIFQNYTDLNLDWYQGYDKALDIYYLAIAYIATMRNWTNLHAFGVSRFLWYYRLIGVVLFEWLQIRALLFIFPNTFEYFFDFIEGVRTRWNPRRLTKRHVVYAAALIWIFIKLPQEYWIHIAQMDVTDFIRENIFDVPVDTPWGTLISDNIGFFVGLIIALVALVLLLRWVLLHKLPPPNWSWTFDADTHRDTDPAYQAQPAAAGYRQTQAERFFDQGMIEKIALLSLILGIFASVLPGIDIPTVQLVIGVIAVVVLNTVITEWLGRRGMSFETAMREFVGVALANFLIVIAYRFLVHRAGGTMDVGATLFFLFLVSIIIALYDRYRPIYLRRVDAERVST